MGAGVAGASVGVTGASVGVAGASVGVPGASVVVVGGGVVEGDYYDEKGVTALATVPSREELLGKLLGSIQSPISNLARVINQIAEQQGGGAAPAEEAAAE